MVLIVQENHTFDNYFGAYCTAPTGSHPSCNNGRNCCEAAPLADPKGTLYSPLSDSFNYQSDHDHSFDCEVCEIHNGAMDFFTVDGGCPTSASQLTSYPCSDPHNYAVADDPLEMATYWNYADNYALADRYFQPTAGGSSSNDMYLAAAHFEFLDDSVLPDAVGAVPHYCVEYPFGGSNNIQEFAGQTTIADVLIEAGFTFKVYADGYADTLAAAQGCTSGSCCPAAGAPIGMTCREVLETSACKYDPSDVPFQYYPQFADDPTYMGDLAADFYADVDNGTLPNFSYIKYRTAANEHPNFSYITDGEANVDSVVSEILFSPIYSSNTLVLLTWDEGGGYFDHVAPPHGIEAFPSTARANLVGTTIPYGTRVPMLAIGPFARQGYVSHVQMEHSSIVQFLEWNFLGPDAIGSINATHPGARDGAVNGIGSMLDPGAVGQDPP